MKDLPGNILNGKEALEKCPEEIEKKMKQWVKENKASIEHCPAFREWMKKEDLSNVSFESLEDCLREQVEEEVTVDEKDVLLGRLKRLKWKVNKAIDMAEELAHPEKSKEEKADVVASGKAKTYHDVLELIKDLSASREEWSVKKKEIVKLLDLDEEKIDEALKHLEENKRVFCPEEGLYQV